MEGAGVSRKMRPKLESRLIGLLIVGSVAILPAGAQAATVGESAGTLAYSTLSGETNHVTIEPWGLALKVSETGSRASRPLVLNPGPGCVTLSTSSVTCDATVSRLSVDLADGDDFFDASAITIPAAVTCGTGQDTVTPNPLDSLASDCEPAVAAAPEPAPAVVPTAEPEAPAPVKTLAISAAGIARVPVLCPAHSGGCAGLVALELRSARLGASRFTAKAGTAPIIPVRLSKRGRQRIIRRHNRRGRIRVVTRSPNAGTVVTTQDVTFTAGRGRR